MPPNKIRKIPPDANWDDSQFSMGEYRKRISAIGKSPTDYSSLIFQLRNPNTYRTTSLAREIVQVTKLNPKLNEHDVAVLLNVPVRYVRVVCKRYGLVLPPRRTYGGKYS